MLKDWAKKDEELKAASQSQDVEMTDANGAVSGSDEERVARLRACFAEHREKFAANAFLQQLLGSV